MLNPSSNNPTSVISQAQGAPTSSRGLNREAGNLAVPPGPVAPTYAPDQLHVSRSAGALERASVRPSLAPVPARSASPVGAFDAIAHTVGGFFSRLVALFANWFAGPREQALAAPAIARGVRLDRPAPVDAGQIVSNNGASLVVDDVREGIIAPNSSR